MTYEKHTFIKPQELRVFERQNDDKTPILFTLIGLPGSGKSYLASRIAIGDGKGGFYYPTIHSSDELRKELYGDVDDQTHNAEIFNELHKRIRNDLVRGMDTIYDATNVSKKRRIGYFREISKIKCRKIAIVTLAPYEVCLSQNLQREKTVPEYVIKNMYMHWCPPALNEGFDEIHLFYNYGDLDKDYYSPNNFFEGRIGANYISQDNSHHTLTIGQHCSEAGRYAIKKYSDLILGLAAHFHDIGKPFTKTKLNKKGEFDGNYHYYQHHCVGAYDVFFYLDHFSEEMLSPRDLVYISNLIYYHMMPFTKWRQSEKAKLKDKKLIGNKMFTDIMRLHEADTFAH